MKYYDPYYIINPTKPIDRLPEQGRSTSGRYTHKTILNVMDHENFGIDHWMWARAARGTRERLDTMRGEDFRFSVIPDETLFSWRMICEMYETARDVLLEGKSDDQAVQAAHNYLSRKQYETATMALKNIVKTIPSMKSQCQAISNWMQENWDLIPEIEL